MDMDFATIGRFDTFHPPSSQDDVTKSATRTQIPLFLPWLGHVEGLGSWRKPSLAKSGTVSGIRVCHFVRKPPPPLPKKKQSFRFLLETTKKGNLEHKGVWATSRHTHKPLGEYMGNIDHLLPDTMTKPHMYHRQMLVLAYLLVLSGTRE